MGFIPDVEKIAGLLPPLRQTLFFSATMPPEIQKLANRFLRNPKSVSVAPPASTADNVTQILIDLPSDNDWLKREALRILLKRENVQNAFIFCNHKRDVAILDKSLKRHGFNAGALHGDMDQSSRTATLESFRNGTITFLACSDVAARGLDIADVSHVFNFDVPFNAEDYVHRIGRTARAGKSGTAYTLVTPEDAKLIAAIEELIKQKIPHETIADLPAPRPSSRRKPEGKSRSHGRARHLKPRHTRPPKKEHTASHPAAPSHVPALPAQNKNVKARPHKDQHAHGKPQGFGDNLPALLRRPPARRKGVV